MKFIHLSDLHIGKRLHEVPLIEDQEYVLDKILEITVKEAPEGVIIAGDVYDKAVPSTEAVAVFDGFLVRLAAAVPHVFIVSGNHDSAERLAFGARLMEGEGIHVSPVYSGECRSVALADEHGRVNVYLLPFVKPATVRRYFENERIESYTDAVRAALSSIELNEGERNILVTHQFVAGGVASDSEELSVGGSDCVDASVLSGFDYVALGHLHRPQNTAENIRYSGSPLKYSFSEARDEKSVTVLELGKKGEMSVRVLPLTPLHEVRRLRGSYDELAARDFYNGTTLREDYVEITLTDEEEIPEAMGKLRAIYKNLLSFSYDNKRTRAGTNVDLPAALPERSPYELAAELYRIQNGSELSREQSKLLRELIDDIWEGET